jgi:hypothetical protein
MIRRSWRPAPIAYRRWITRESPASRPLTVRERLVRRLRILRAGLRQIGGREQDRRAEREPASVPHPNVVSILDIRLSSQSDRGR